MFQKVVIRVARIFIVAALVCAGSTELAAQGLTARIAPQAASYRWGETVGLDDSPLFGGGAAIGFGRYVLLRSAYSVASDVPTRLAAAGYGGGSAEENTVKASFLSTDVQLRLGSSRFAPVVMGGGGVLGFSPDGRDRIQQVAVSYGGGLDANLTEWLNAQLLVRNMRFRLDRSGIAGETGGPAPDDPNRDAVRSALTLTASLGARIGGSRRSESADQLDDDMGRAFSGGEGLMIPVELHAGVVRFADAFAIGDQAMAGVRGGLDFGPYFGLRGSYARGLSNGIQSLSAMSTWTGEAQFNVGKVTGVSPHLLLGFGQMTFWGDFLDENGFRPDDRDVLILGAGLGIPLGGRSRFIVALRDYVTSSGSPSAVSTTADLRHSFGLSTGLSFDLRGRRAPTLGTRPTIMEEEPAAVTAEATPPAPPVDSMVAPETPPVAVDTPPAAEVVRADDPVATPPVAEIAAADTTAASVYHSGRVVSIPIPTEGELYIRYGPTPVPGTGPQRPAQEADLPAGEGPSGAAAASMAPDSAAIAGLIRAEISSALSAQAAPPAADLAALEARLTERITASLQALAEARAADSVRVAGAVQAEVERLRTDSTVVTRADLLAMENRIAERLSAVPAQAPAATQTPADSADVVRREDLAAMETRIVEQVASALARRDSAAIPPQPQAAPTPSAEIEALSRQVEALTRMVQAREAGGAAPQPVVVEVESGGAVAVTDRDRGPFVRGGAARIGTYSVRDSGRGIGGSADVLVGGLWSDRLRPFVGLEVGRSGVNGGIGGSAYTGHVTSFGGHAGVALDLPRFRSVAPSASLGLVGVGGGVSGNSPFEEGLIEDLYGGFVMGPRISVDAAWTRTPDTRWSLVTSLARTWAGSRGGWSFQVGMRWFRRGYEAEVRPFFVRVPATDQPTTLAPTTAPAGQPEPPATEQPVQPQPPAAGEPGVAAAPDSVVLSRLDEMQQRLEEERQARLRSQAVADSLAESARMARERADSLAEQSAETARLEREREAAAVQREQIVRELTGLVGVVEGVQAVRSSDRGLEVILGGGLFASGSGELTPESSGRVDRVARVLTRVEGYSFLVDGHTDASGSDEANLVLSRRRAEAVRGVLVGAGIDANRVAVRASGESSPLAGNDTPQGRALNRRVEIVVIDFPGR